MIPVHATRFPCDCSLPCYTVLSHTHVCVSEQPVGLTDKAAFLNFTDHQEAKVLNEVEDEVRAEFHFALETPLLLLEPLHAWVSGYPDSSPFNLFCSNILSCNSFRRLKPRVLMLAQRAFFGPPENVRMDSQIWGRLKKNAEQHRNMGSQKYIQTHFYGLSECPLWDRS